MKTGTIIFIVLMVVLVAATIALYFVGKRMQTRKEEQEAQLAAAAQQVTMLIIDKKRVRMCDAGLPAVVMEQTPKRYRKAKLPIVKAKVGPQIMTLIAMDEIYDQIPVKMEVKATVSGLYISGVRGLRGPLPKPEVTKKTLRSRINNMYKNARAKVDEIQSDNGKGSKTAGKTAAKNKKK